MPCLGTQDIGPTKAFYLAFLEEQVKISTRQWVDKTRLIKNLLRSDSSLLVCRIYWKTFVKVRFTGVSTKFTQEKCISRVVAFLEASSAEKYDRTIFGHDRKT